MDIGVTTVECSQKQGHRKLLPVEVEDMLISLTARTPLSDSNSVCPTSFARFIRAENADPPYFLEKPPKTGLTNSSSNGKEEVMLVINLTPSTTAATIRVNVGSASDDSILHTKKISKLKLAEDKSDEEEDAPETEIFKGEDTRDVAFYVKVESTEISECECVKPKKRMTFPSLRK